MKTENIIFFVLLILVIGGLIVWQLEHMGVIKMGFTNRFNKNSKKRFVSNSSSYYKK
jgi:biopolymer transport protein ExbB/TolQ